MYIPRTSEQFIEKAAAQFPVLLVTGPRQVGKTTVLRHLATKNRQYVTLDDPTLAALAREEPSLFLQRFGTPLIIDEIQYAPELLPYIKMEVDEKRLPGMFWLTGSQQFQLMRGVSESLAGRVGIINLLGLSLKELHRQAESSQPFLPTREFLLQSSRNAWSHTLPEIYEFIWRGSYPVLWITDGEQGGGTASGAGNIRGGGYGDGRFEPNPSGVGRDLFYSSYLQTYLQRDVRDLANVGDESAFLKFLRASAARTGQLLNVSDLARDAGISPPTAKRWLSILEASNIVYLLEPYYTNTTKRLVKAPKLYFLDTGLCAYLTEWSTPATLEAGALSGSIFETYVFSEILKSYWFNGQRAPLYYFRDKDKKEIDLLIVKDDTIYPVEIKKTASPGKEHTKNFQGLRALGKKVGGGAVICLTEAYLPLDETSSALSVGCL
jgi:predicted AAA+ superfamily ATPase